MEFALLRLSDQYWKCFPQSEEVLLLQATEEKEVKSEQVWALAQLLEKSPPPGWIECVLASTSIALVFDPQKTTHIEVYEYLKSIKNTHMLLTPGRKIAVPVCYDLGLDWTKVATVTGLSKPEIIARHTAGIYRVTMMGFTPGFIYLEGLSEALACPRKDVPRVRIPEGSIGIGGAQTGIYSLPSPGGWQIIGQTPMAFFDLSNPSPNRLTLGDELSFYAIDQVAFETWDQSTKDFKQ